MDLYRCFVFDRTGTRSSCQTIHAETNGHARSIAMDLLCGDPLIQKMEVWRNADLAFRLNRNQAHLEGFDDTRVAIKSTS